LRRVLILLRIAIGVALVAAILYVLVPIWAIPMIDVANKGIVIDCSQWPDAEASECEEAALFEVRSLDNDPEEEWWLPPVTRVIVPPDGCGLWEFERGPHYTSSISQLC
jgi:hypothetical protein